MFMTPWLRSMKSALRPRTGRASRAASKRMRRQAPLIPVAPQVELLEDRTLLAVSSSFIFATNTLFVQSDSNDPIVITVFGTVLINGAQPDDGPLNPAIVNGILVQGGPDGNNIDLTGVFAADFTGLSNSDITVNGDDGPDTISVSEIGGFYNGDNGDDVILGDNTGAPGGITVDAGNGEDSVLGGLGADSIIGDDGDDTINGSSGDDTIDGGDGEDSLLGDTNTGAMGNDTIRGGAGADTIFGDFTMLASSVGGADFIVGESGDDSIYGGGGADTLRGSGNDDTIIGGFGNDAIFGQGGDDLMYGGEEAGDDTMRNDGEDTLMGQQGNDTGHGGTGNDCLVGAQGDDILNGNDGKDFLNGNNGVDMLDGGNDEDTLLGGSNDDTLFGGFDDDTLRGQAHNDSLNGGPGTDLLDGGNGNDTLQASSEQIVFLDFVSKFDVGEHIYLNEDLNENGLLDFGEDTNGNGLLDNDPEFIKNLLEADFSNYEVTFTRFQPAGGDFITVFFNDDPTVAGTTFPEMPFLTIGEASEFDARNAALDGMAQVDLNGFLGPLTAGDPVVVQRQKFNVASAYVSAHEIGNLMGLRNSDAFGPLGINPATGNPFGLPTDPGTNAGFDLTLEDFLPIFPGPGQPGAGPGDAGESNLHLMTAPTAFVTNLNDGVIDLNDPSRNTYFSERSAVKLAFGDTGNLERERRPDEVNPNFVATLKTFANPQQLTLRDLGTPNSLVAGRNATFEFDVSATAVWDGIVLRPTGFQDPDIPMRDFERSEDDYYAFDGNAGEIVEIVVNSELLRRFVDDGLTVNSMIRVFDSNGRPVDYFPGRDPMNLPFSVEARIRSDSAINDRFDDNSEPVESPPGSGTFVNFAAPDEDPIILSLLLPATDTYRVMISEPYQRGIFAIPINDDDPTMGGFQELGHLVELDPITGVELNRFDVEAITGVPTSTPATVPATLGGAAVAFDPNLNILYYINPTRSNQLFRLDPDTGAQVMPPVTMAFPLIGAAMIPSDPGIHGMSLLNSDNLLFVDVVNDNLYRMAPGTGALLDLMDIDNISENLLGDPAAGQPVTNAERTTWENFNAGSANPEGGDTPFIVGAPFGGPLDGGNVAGQYQLVEGIAHDPGMGMPNQSPYHIGFNRTSQGNPDDIDASFTFQITPATGAPEGIAFVLGETTSAQFGIAGAGPALPGGFGNGGIETTGGGFVNSLSMALDTRDNDGAGTGDPNDNHITIRLNGGAVPILEFTPIPNMDDGALHTARLLVQARDTSGQPINAGTGNVGVTGTEICVFIDGVLEECTFVAGPDGQEYTTVVGESRALFYSDVDGTTNFGTAAIDNVQVDFRVPLVRNVTPGLAIARQIPVVAGGVLGANTTLTRALILDEDDQGNQIVHEVATVTGLPGVTVNNTGAVTSSFAPNTAQATAFNDYVAIGVQHLHNNGFTETGLPVGTQVYLGTGINAVLGNQVHAFNRGGDDPGLPGGFNQPMSGFTSPPNIVDPVTGFNNTWDSTAAPVFGLVSPVSLLDGNTGGVASNPAFFLTPEGNPQYNLKDFGADDVLGLDTFATGLPDQVDFGNYELFIYRFAAGPTTEDDGVGNTLVGGNGDDEIRGSSSNDFIRGNAGNDVIDGRAGEDTILGGSGADTLFGGNGDDTLDGQNGVDEVFGGAGDDEVIFDVNTGSDGTIEGGPGTDIMRVVTADKNDTVRLEADGSKVRITVTAPNQNPVTLSSQVLEVLRIETNRGDDRVFVGDLSGVTRLQLLDVDLGGGADLLDATGQFDTSIRISVLGQNGADTLIGGRGNDSLNGGNGGDRILGDRGNDTLDGDSGVDRIFGGDDDDFIVGGDSRDHINGDAGDDTINGNSGDDNLFGDAGADSIVGELGADSIDGGAGDDTLLGNDGDDTLRGGDGADTAFGDGGVDSLDGGDGNDTLSGGDDDDTIVGGGGADSLFGNENDDFLNGNAGNDSLSGDNGDDRLLGGSGQDELDGQFGDDTLNGNAGFDSIRGGDGEDSLVGGTGDDTLNGGDGHDTLLGQAGNDGLAGHDGDDVLNGGGETDTLIAGDGNDTLRGGAGGDYLVGGEGNDNLDGQGATDTLSGGEGQDTLNGVPDDVIDESIEDMFDPSDPEFAWINQV